MASKQVEALLKKAATDDVFRLSLSSNLEKTLKDHNMKISATDMAALKKVNFKKPLLGGVAATWVHIYK